MTEPRQYSAMDWKTAGIAFGMALAIYFFTLAPAITLEYSGQLVVAANHLGVARPPGYPVWTLLAKGFITLFPLATYQGHPNPAWAVNLMSAVFGALACGLLALLASRESRQLASASRPMPAAIGVFSGIAAALLFALSPAMWSQAVIAETHTLTAFHFLLLLALSLRWMTTRDERGAYLPAFLFGFGLSISPMLVLHAPVLLLAAAFVSRQALARVAIAMTLFLGFIAAEYRIGSASPAAAAAVLGATLAAVLLLAMFRPSRPAAGLLLLLLAGLIPYVYLPLASARNPPMNMGQAHTWTGFWHVLNRGQYESLGRPLNPFAAPVEFARQLAWYARLAAAQFSAPLAALALVPAGAIPWLPRSGRKTLALALAAFAAFALGVLIGAKPMPDVQNTFAARVLFIPSFALLALLAGLGLALLIRGGARLAATYGTSTAMR